MSKTNPLLIEIGQGLSIRVGFPTIVSWNSSTRPKKARKGTFGFNSQTNNLEYWDGANWFAAAMNEA